MPLALTFAALGVRHPEAGGTAAYTKAAFGRRTGTSTGWWFLTGVVLGAPAVALIGGFYVAELLNVGREGAIVAAAAMIAGVIAANAAGLKTTARLQLGMAGVLAALLLVAVLTALPETRSRELDAVRAARLGGGRQRGERADALVHRLGGGLATSPASCRTRRASSRGRSSPRSASSSSSTSGWRGVGRRARRDAVTGPARRPDGRGPRRDRAGPSPRSWRCC